MLMTHLDPLIKCRVIFCGMMFDQHFTNHHLIKASNAKTIFFVKGSPTPSASTTPPVSLEKTSNLGSQFRRRFYEVQSDLQLFPGRSFAPTVVTKSTQHTWALHLRRSKTWLRRSSVHWRVRWTRTASFLFFWRPRFRGFVTSRKPPETKLSSNSRRSRFQSEILLSHASLWCHTWKEVWIVKRYIDRYQLKYYTALVECPCSTLFYPCPDASNILDPWDKISNLLNATLVNRAIVSYFVFWRLSNIALNF